MITALEKLSAQIGTIEKVVKTTEKLTKILEKNEGNIDKLLKEISETNENIKTMLDIFKGKEKTK